MREYLSRRVPSFKFEKQAGLHHSFGKIGANTMKIAFPSAAPGGLNGALSSHFGHCEVFTLVDVEGDEVKQVNSLPNAPHEQGGCMAPVMTLKNAGVEMLVAGGMGQRPLLGFQQVGIEVYFNENAATVDEALQLILGGKARKFGPAHVCGGGGGGCGSHQD